MENENSSQPRCRRLNCMLTSLEFCGVKENGQPWYLCNKHAYEFRMAELSLTTDKKLPEKLEENPDIQNWKNWLKINDRGNRK